MLIWRAHLQFMIDSGVEDFARRKDKECCPNNGKSFLSVPPRSFGIISWLVWWMINCCRVWGSLCTDHGYSMSYLQQLLWFVCAFLGAAVPRPFETHFGYSPKWIQFNHEFIAIDRLKLTLKKSSGGFILFLKMRYFSFI